MKKLIFVFTFLLLVVACFSQIEAQTLGNEWISYQKPYAKVAVLGNETGTGNQGIYRITYAQLAQADFPVTEDPRRFQMFNKGKEIAIRVVGEQDGRFDRNDYIEFWSKGNLDGIDPEMYANPADAPNPYIPIYDSHGMYFVTIANNPKRMAYSYENSATLPIETAHTQEMIYAPSETFNRGSLFPTSIINRDFGSTAIIVSHFMPNKAVCGYPSFAGLALTIPFGFENFIQNTSVEIETNFTGAVNAFNEVTLFYNNKSIGKVSVVNYGRAKINTKVDSVRLNGAFNLTYTNTSPDGNSSIAPNYFRVNYRQGFDMGQSAYRKFMLDAKSVGKSKIVLQGVNDRTIIYDITDEYNVRLIGYDSAGNQRTAVVPNTDIRRTLVADSRINSVTSVTKVIFEPLNISANFLIVAPKHLMAAVGNVPDVVKEYANYRETYLGGTHTSSVVDIQQLYNQFCYGYFNPLAVRRYVDYMLRVNVNPPRALFIIGRGVQLTNFYRNGRPKNFIPTLGYPSSDNEFTNGLGGNPRFVPKVPVGRLVAETPQEVMNYLNKVKEHEALAANVAWRKNIIHLSGGTYENENKLFNTYMNGYKSVVDIGFRGSNVKTIRKSTSDYVEYINLRDELNAGLSLITMFGHSGAAFSDVEIGQPNDPQTGYNNKGKYPMILQNGCSSANVFRVSSEGSDARRDYRTPSEYWIVTPDKGALLYLANTSFGEAGNLNLYTRYFYEVAFNDVKYANASIGEIMQETIRRFVAINDVEIGTAHAQQMLLQGDPAIVMFGKRFEFVKPDYVVEDKNLFIKTFNNERLNAATDSFQICMAVANTGIVNLSPLTVSIKRTFNDFSFIQYPTKTYPAIRNLDTICFTITTPKDVKPKALGLNQFEVKVDYENRIDELDEQNNTANLSFTLKKATMLPIAPKEYSIVSSQPVYFVAQNTDAFTRERTYRFQLDTSYLFNSNYKKDTVVTSYIVSQWTTNLLPDIKANDSTVYYWRIRYADLRPEDDTTWVSSSFVYIKDSPSGWSQSRFPQYTKNVSKGVAPSIANKRWIFPELTSKIDVNVVPYDGDRNNGKWKSYYMNLNDQLYAYETSCTQQSFPAGYIKLLCLAIDQQTGEPYNPALGLSSFSSVGHPCGTSSLVAAIANDGGLLQYVSLVKQGDYIVMMPAGDANLTGASSSPTFVAAFAAFGVNASNLQQLGYNLSFFIVGQKGASQPLSFQVAAAGQSIKTSYTIRRQAYEGSVNSTLIGPAASWGNVFRTVNGFDNPKDTWRIDVVGVDFNGNENLLFGNIKPDAFDIKNIDAKANPYLRLKLQVSDSARKTPYQLQRWQVIYKEVPEGILLYDTLTYRENTVLQVIEGDSVKMKFNFLNISGNDFPEPLTVQYRIRNANTGKDTTITEKMKKQLLRNQFQPIEVKLNSLNFKGENTLTVFVNPRIQAEQFYENNLLEARFRVKPDDVNPVLEVAFDGKYLLNGDIVSPTPLILITLKDENKFLLKKDTIGMEMYLKACESCLAKRINFNDQNLIWTPASAASNNKFTIEYRPKKLTNGTYTLTVQGKDVTGNESGKLPYSITFKVITENTVSNFYPYPNPFSTNTRFVFTLTGEIPDQIRIQIMTITGKVVKTLFKEDLGNLRIGTNLTDYAWDGTDEYGDKLANGVYLYKVDVKTASKDYEHASTAADDLFKNGYGKMYLMR